MGNGASVASQEEGVDNEAILKKLQEEQRKHEQQINVKKTLSNKSINSASVTPSTGSTQSKTAQSRAEKKESNALKKLALGTNSYKDTQRDYDETCDSLGVNKVQNIQWKASSDSTGPKHEPPSRTPTPKGTGDGAVFFPADSKQGKVKPPPPSQRPAPPPSRPVTHQSVMSPANSTNSSGKRPGPPNLVQHQQPFSPHSSLSGPNHVQQSMSNIQFQFATGGSTAEPTPHSFHAPLSINSTTAAADTTHQFNQQPLNINMASSSSGSITAVPKGPPPSGPPPSGPHGLPIRPFGGGPPSRLDVDGSDDDVLADFTLGSAAVVQSPTPEIVPTLQFNFASSYNLKQQHNESTEDKGTEAILGAQAPVKTIAVTKGFGQPKHRIDCIPAPAAAPAPSTTIAQQQIAHRSGTASPVVGPPTGSGRAGVGAVPIGVRVGSAQPMMSISQSGPLHAVHTRPTTTSTTAAATTTAPATHQLLHLQSPGAAGGGGPPPTNGPGSGRIKSQVTTPASQQYSRTPASRGGGGPAPMAPLPQKLEVKETTDVKRKNAHLPQRMSHQLPTTGDWLKKRYIVNNYILLDNIGSGSYGEVRLCKDRTSDKLFAIKIISKDFLKKKKAGKNSETYFEDIKREIAIMKQLNHPNVLRLFEVLDDPNVNKMYLVLEYMKMGDLVNVLKNREEDTNANTAEVSAASASNVAPTTSTGTTAAATESISKGFTPLSDLEVWNICRQLVSGIKYLHKQNVVHGDIKPQNLLVGEDMVLKIADFGISKMLSQSGQKLGDAAGTPAFMSPELCEGKKSFSGQLADIWAMGATIFMLRYGHPPFVAKTILGLYNKIIGDPLVFPGPIDPALQDLLESMLEKDPSKRITIEQIIRHPFMKQPPHLRQQSMSIASVSTRNSTGAAAATVSATPIQQKYAVAGTRVSSLESSEEDQQHHPKKRTDAMQASFAETANTMHSLLQSAGKFKSKLSFNFKPPDTYAAEEEAAMNQPVREVVAEDLFKSIGGGISRVHGNGNGNGEEVEEKEEEGEEDDDEEDEKGSSKARAKMGISKVESTGDESELGGNGSTKALEPGADLMATNWGADVFEMVDDDGNDEDSDEDNDTVDDSTVMSSKKRPDPPPGQPPTSGRQHSNMTKEEEERRAKVFQKKSNRKSAENIMSSIPEKCKNASLGGPPVPVGGGGFAAVKALKETGGSGTGDGRRPISILTNEESASDLSSPSVGGKKSSSKSSSSSGKYKGNMMMMPSPNPSRKSGSMGGGGDEEEEGYEVAGEVTFDEFATIMDTLAKAPRLSKNALNTEDEELEKNYGKSLSPTATVSATAGTPGLEAANGKDHKKQIMSADGSGSAAAAPKHKTSKAVAAAASRNASTERFVADSSSSQLRNENNGVAVAFYSAQGTRHTQEDRCVVYPSIATLKLTPEERAFTVAETNTLSQMSMCCIFDGHSGSTSSQYLAQFFPRALVCNSKFLISKERNNAINDTCVELDRQLCALLREEEDTSGSTGVICVYDGLKHKLTVAGIGDSMCVLSRSGKATVVNKMHRLQDNEEERKRVLQAGGTIKNNRVNGLLGVSRSFGDTQFKESAETDETTFDSIPKGISGKLVVADPEIVNEIITPMTEFAIVASDGLWDVMSPQVAVTFVRNRLLNKKMDLEHVSKELTQEAMSRGTVDNTTVLVMSFHTAAAGQQQGNNSAGGGSSTVSSTTTPIGTGRRGSAPGPGPPPTAPPPK